MIQNKYKEKLQNRTIDPSSDSWEKLQMELDSHRKKEKGKKWQFLKYAAAFLVFAAVGLYFSERGEEIIEDPKIVMPSQKKDLNNIYKNTIDPAAKAEVELEVVTSTGISNSKQPIPIAQEAFPSTLYESIEEEVTLADTHNATGISKIQVTEKGNHDTLSETFVQTTAIPSEETALEEEVARLLSQSKIKLRINEQNLSAKVVSAHSLLNEVEVDLHKDLKQKLLEKITNSLKNPKEVITYQEN